MWEELGISGGTAIIVLAALYFVIKQAVKNGVLAAYEKITGERGRDDLDKYFEKGAEGEKEEPS